MDASPGLMLKRAMASCHVPHWVRKRRRSALHDRHLRLDPPGASVGDERPVHASDVLDLVCADPCHSGGGEGAAQRSWDRPRRVLRGDQPPTRVIGYVSGVGKDRVGLGDNSEVNP